MGEPRGGAWLFRAQRRYLPIPAKLERRRNVSRHPRASIKLKRNALTPALCPAGPLRRGNPRAPFRAHCPALFLAGFYRLGRGSRLGAGFLRSPSGLCSRSHLGTCRCGPWRLTSIYLPGRSRRRSGLGTLAFRPSHRSFALALGRATVYLAECLFKCLDLFADGESFFNGFYGMIPKCRWHESDVTIL
jgi:hypothetical protein